MKIYLAIVGVLYLALAIWCSVAPGMTSEKVGFTLNGPAGQSEFLTVYGGLEFGMAMMFLVPLLFDKATAFAMLSCVLIHVALVAFRSAGMFLYPGSLAETWKLATGEWAILIVGLVLWAINREAIGKAIFNT